MYCICLWSDLERQAAARKVAAALLLQNPGAGCKMGMKDFDDTGTNLTVQSIDSAKFAYPVSISYKQLISTIIFYCHSISTYFRSGYRCDPKAATGLK